MPSQPSKPGYTEGPYHRRGMDVWDSNGNAIACVARYDAGGLLEAESKATGDLFAASWDMAALLRRLVACERPSLSSTEYCLEMSAVLNDASAILARVDGE